MLLVFNPTLLTGFFHPVWDSVVFQCCGLWAIQGLNVPRDTSRGTRMQKKTGHAALKQQLKLCTVHSNNPFILYIHLLAIPLIRLLVAFCFPHVLLLRHVDAASPDSLLFLLDMVGRTEAGTEPESVSVFLPNGQKKESNVGKSLRIECSSRWWMSFTLQSHFAACVHWTVCFHTART